MIRAAIIVFLGVVVGAVGMKLSTRWFEIADSPAVLPQLPAIERYPYETPLELPPLPEILPASATEPLGLATLPLATNADPAAPIMPPATAPATTPTIRPKITEVHEQVLVADTRKTAIWKIPSSSKDVKLNSTSSEGLVLVTNTNEGNWSVYREGSPDAIKAVQSVDAKSRFVTFTLPRDALPDGKGRLFLAEKNDTPPVDAIELDLADTSSTADPLTVTDLFPSRYLDKAFGNVTDATPLVIINGYFRVRGNTSVGEDLRFFLWETSGYINEIPRDRVRSIPRRQGEWEYELRLEARATNSRAAVLVRRVTGEPKHYDAKWLIPIEWKSRPTPAAPTFANTLDVPESGSPPSKAPISPLSPGANNYLVADSGATPIYRANRKGQFTIAAIAPDATQLLLFIDGQAAPTQVVGVTDSAVVEFPSVVLSGDGDHRIEVAAANGGDPPGPRATAIVRLRSTGPQAVQATSPGFGSGAQRKETIRIQFSGDDLDADSIRKIANYSLVHNEGANGGSKALSDLKYDATSKIVTLTAADIVPGTYTLTVKSKFEGGGIRDLFGNYLVSQEGGQATDQSFVFTAIENSTTNPSVAATTLSLTTGPNVEYKEFEPRKTFANGFNPADRVETRVVRLYYNRDAARVVQVVNRDAKAYNAPSVDVRRRAADRSRDEANAITDERKRQESIAIQAATESRAAEAKVKELQSRASTARTQAAVANSQVSQRQEQLLVAQRTLGRDRTDITTRKATDTSIDAAKLRRDRAELELSQLRQVIAAGGGSETDGPAKLDADILNQEQVVRVRKNDLAREYLAVRNEAEKTDAGVINAKRKVQIAEGGLNAATSANDRAKYEAELARANVEYSNAIQNAIVGTPAFSARIEKATQAVDTETLKLNQITAAKKALQDIPAVKQALADAETELNRAAALAGGRAATDAGADSATDSVTTLEAEIRKLQAAATAAQADEQAVQTSLPQAIADLQAKRIKEVEALQALRSLEQKELRGREDQFRREVAAAKEDPDIYAPGKPGSDDPVRQCSLSVIGEGLIQIRGPIKGVNIIRTMINQIDSPTGQVRIGVHTVQVNGERVDRMNRVVANIQRYLDHSRFLTSQSTQILRKAITTVAARKAEEAAATLPPNCTAAEREQKYLASFFGREFIDELRGLDSEFLRTGNKLLSLHSMDSTSLSAALSLLALARNDVRQEIMHEFDTQVRTKLPEAELNFYLAGLACPNKCEACFDKKFCVLANNARFESFRGFFNVEILGPDTLTPPQREFIKLAQIFKVRLVTELELKQRVVERSLLEERLGDYQKELQEARDRDEAARKALIEVQDTMQAAIANATVAFSEAVALLDAVEEEIGSQDRILDELLKSAGYRTITRNGITTLSWNQNKSMTYKFGDLVMPLPQIKNLKDPDPRKHVFILDNVKQQALKTAFRDTARYIGRFYYISSDKYAIFKLTQDSLSKIAMDSSVTIGELVDLHQNLKTILAIIHENALSTRREISAILNELRKDRPDLTDVLKKYSALRLEVLGKLRDGDDLKKTVQGLFRDQLDPPFSKLQQAAVQYQAAVRRAELARRPLDEKKLLDMLIDDMEDKYIELLDGTRAHTANYDNYLKALSTALDDDFNTQFYQPAFRKIRSLGAGWDVQLGQIESTTVLTNNRVFAKVSPAASMEFDLPKRDIFVKEAFKGAKAAVDEYGALLNDPTFLALTKLYSGSSTAAPFGGGGLSPVRNVLPGLPSSADELLMAQAGPNRKEFGAALESLIPDPAVYKFETGTGYEIRPVMSPDGQAVVFNFDYMYTTDVREPVRADEKHLGRVKRHFVHTDVQLSNFEMREVSKYWVSIKAARTSRGVQLLQDVPGVGVLFRPLPSASSSLQQNLIYAQASLFPTLFDLMGLRYAPTIADIDPEFTKNDEFVVRGRRDYLRQFIFDYGASRVDDALRILYGERRPDLYRSQHTIPWKHPNGYYGPGMRQRDAELQEGYDPREAYPPTQFTPGMRLPLPQGPTRGELDQYEINPPAGVSQPSSLTQPGTTTQSLPQPREYAAQPLGTTVTQERGPQNLAPIQSPPRLVAPGNAQPTPSIPTPSIPTPSIPTPSIPTPSIPPPSPITNFRPRSP